MQKIFQNEETQREEAQRWSDREFDLFSVANLFEPFHKTFCMQTSDKFRKNIKHILLSSFFFQSFDILVFFSKINQFWFGYQ